MEWRRSYWTSGPGAKETHITYERKGRRVIRPAQHIEATLSTLRREAVTKAASKLRDTESLVKLMADGTKASILVGKHTLAITLTGRATTGIVHLRATDFGALAKAVSGLSLTGNAKVSFEIDPGVGMRVGFGTSLATYELYVPVLQPGSFKPYTHGFRPMAVA